MRKGKTAAKLMAELQGNSMFQNAVADREESRQSRQTQYNRILKPVIAELRALGLCGDSLQEIVEGNSPLKGEAVNVLCNSLQTVEGNRPLESLVRALAAAAASIDGQCLAECFDKTNDESL